MIETSGPRDYYLYNAPTITAKSHLGLPGVARFADFFRIINRNVTVVDRNNVLRTPVRTKVLFPIPEFREFRATYEEICDARAVDILSHAERQDLPVYLFYSGGIDSTLVLVSFLKNASPAQRNRLTLLLTKESIGENPTFYRSHVQGKLKQKMAIMYPFLLNKRGVFVCGELNDQLFGSDILRTLIAQFGPGSIQAKYDRETFFRMWRGSFESAASLEWFLDLFQLVKDKSPIPLHTNFDFLWWYNFSLKWQSAALRLLLYAANLNQGQIDNDFMKDNYFAFFGTEDFQLWSMNNMHLKIKDSWESYKFAAKEIIYKFHPDADYLKYKTKRGSLSMVIRHQEQKNFMTDSFSMHMDQSPDQWFNPENSFVDLKIVNRGAA